MVACQTVTDVLSERDEIANRVARSGNLDPFFVQTGKFELAGYRRFSAPADPTVSIYIEGDGLAFLSESVVSRDPTPRDPVSLRLAARDPSPNVAYLARPCQYVDAPSRANCQYTYWTKARFAPEVVRETNLAVDAIKKNAGAQSVRLYGYSGGGVLAALVAGVRSDVTSLVTFGAPLDHVTWTRVKRFTPLSESMTPMTDVRDLARIPQVHYLGEDDDVVPPIAVTSFVEAVRAAGGNARFVEVPDVGHRCCWQQRWPALGPIEGHRS